MSDIINIRDLSLRRLFKREEIQMLQIQLDTIQIGQSFQIRNSWRNKISELTNKEDFPFCFKVVDVIRNTTKAENFYLCESIPNDKKEKVIKITVGESVIQYVTSAEVENCNVGLYFRDYLPMEGKKLLIKDMKDSLKIYPYQFLFKVCIEQKIPCLKFVFKNLLDFSEALFNMYSKNSWKILDDSDIYMSDVEKMYQDTFIHKGYVMLVCNTFANYLQELGQTEDAEDLRERAVLHDNSKILNKDEFRALTSIINDKSCLKDANSKLSQFKQDAIELHWRNNEHHPEHYEDISQMTPRARREFVCDCCARSIQYKTDLLEFMETRLKDRFHFSDMVRDEILYNCKILLNLLNKDK